MKKNLSTKHDFKAKNALPIPNVFLIRKDHTFVSCNEQQAKELGFNNPKDIIGKSLYDLYPTEVAYRLIAHNLLVMDTQLEHTFEEEILVNGLLRSYTSTKKPFYIENQVFGVIGTSEDTTLQLTPEKQALQSKASIEKFLGESILALTSLNQKVSGEIAAGVCINPQDYLLSANAYFENLIASIPLHIYWLNREGKYLGCGNAQADTWKMSSRFDVIGKTNRDIYEQHYGSEPTFKDGINKDVMCNQRSRVVEELAKFPDGKQKNYLSSKAPLFDDTGVVVGMIGASIPLSK